VEIEMLKNPEFFDLDYPNAAIFVGFDGQETWCADLGDIMYAESRDYERYIKSLQPMFDELAKAEELEIIQDKLENKI